LIVEPGVISGWGSFRKLRLLSELVCQAFEVFFHESGVANEVFRYEAEEWI